MNKDLPSLLLFLASKKVGREKKKQKHDLPDNNTVKNARY